MTWWCNGMTSIVGSKKVVSPDYSDSNVVTVIPM